MITKEITFTDLDGKTVTKKYQFRLNKADLVKFHVSKKGGMDAYLRKIIATDDNLEILNAFEAIITAAVGRREGDEFVRNQQYTNEFKQTDAYSELLFELFGDAAEAARFFNGMIPQELLQDQKTEYSDEELLSMPQDQFDNLIGTDTRKMSTHHFGLAMARRQQVERPAA